MTTTDSPAPAQEGMHPLWLASPLLAVAVAIGNAEGFPEDVSNHQPLEAALVALVDKFLKLYGTTPGFVSYGFFVEDIGGECRLIGSGPPSYVYVSRATWEVLNLTGWSRHDQRLYKLAERRHWLWLLTSLPELIEGLNKPQS